MEKENEQKEKERTRHEAERFCASHIYRSLYDLPRLLDGIPEDRIHIGIEPRPFPKKDCAHPTDLEEGERMIHCPYSTGCECELNHYPSSLPGCETDAVYTLSQAAAIASRFFNGWQRPPTLGDRSVVARFSFTLQDLALFDLTSADIKYRLLDQFFEMDDWSHEKKCLFNHNLWLRTRRMLGVCRHVKDTHHHWNQVVKKVKQLRESPEKLGSNFNERLKAHQKVGRRLSGLETRALSAGQQQQLQQQEDEDSPTERLQEIHTLRFYCFDRSHQIRQVTAAANSASGKYPTSGIQVAVTLSGSKAIRTFLTRLVVPPVKVPAQCMWSTVENDISPRPSSSSSSSSRKKDIHRQRKSDKDATTDSLIVNHHEPPPENASVAKKKKKIKSKVEELVQKTLDVVKKRRTSRVPEVCFPLVRYAWREDPGNPNSPEVMHVDFVKQQEDDQSWSFYCVAHLYGQWNPQRKKWNFMVPVKPRAQQVRLPPLNRKVVQVLQMSPPGVERDDMPNKDAYRSFACAALGVPFCGDVPVFFNNALLITVWHM